MKKTLLALTAISLLAGQAAFAVNQNNVTAGSFTMVTNATGCAYNSESKQFAPTEGRTIYSYTSNANFDLKPSGYNVLLGQTVAVPTSKVGGISEAFLSTNPHATSAVAYNYNKVTLALYGPGSTQLEVVPSSVNVPSFCLR